MELPLKEVNQAVVSMSEQDIKTSSRKGKYTTTFMPEGRVVIGKYAVENGKPVLDTGITCGVQCIQNTSMMI